MTTPAWVVHMPCGNVLVDLQGAVPEQLRRERRGICDRDDLVVVAVHDKCRHVDDLQVLGEVGLRERLDAVIVGLGTALSCFAATKFLDHALRRGSRRVGCSCRRVRSRDRRRTAYGWRRAACWEIVEHVDRQAAGVGRRLHHDRRNRSDQHQLGNAPLSAGRGVRRSASPHRRRWSDRHGWRSGGRDAPPPRRRRPRSGPCRDHRRPGSSDHGLGGRARPRDTPRRRRRASGCPSRRHSAAIEEVLGIRLRNSYIAPSRHRDCARRALQVDSRLVTHI